MNYKNNLKIVNLDIGLLKPSTYNPRIFDAKATNDLTRSIKKFGLVEPLLVNSAPSRKNILIGGHFRLKVAKDLGYKQVPIVYIRIDDLETEKNLNLRLNKNTGSWNYDLLKEMDLDLLLEVGFGDVELSECWDMDTEVENDDFNVNNEIKKIKKSKVKPGDIYRLGMSKLICGDCLDPEIIKKLMGNERASLVINDPPYNLNVNYQKGIGGKRNYTNDELDDNKSPEEYEKFLKTSLQNAMQICKPDAHIFYFCDQAYVGLVQKIYAEMGVKYKRTCIWVKGPFNPTPQISFNKSYEPAVYGIIGKPYISNHLKNLSEILNKDVEPGNRAIDSIIDIFDIWVAKRTPGQLMNHPTQKPLDLYSKPLKRCSKPGDIILDMFCGSGTSLCACEQLKRRAFVCEQDPVFCEVILNRFKKLTGKNYEKIN